MQISGLTATDQTFIQALYRQLLNRDASADDVSYFTSKVLPAVITLPTSRSPGT